MRAARRILSDDQRDLFATAPGLPAGFAYRGDVISAGEEQDLVERFAELPFKPFEFHGFLGKRRVVSFGWRYDYAGRALQESDPIPEFLLPLRNRVAQFSDIPVDGLQQILINEYAPGVGIGWHRDKPMFKDVVAVSLLSPCVLRLRRNDGAGWDRTSIAVAPRSAYLLRGASRREWEHSVPPVDRLRYSVTFRNFVATDGIGSP
jgi:alkylated DNA repair dioxygenase AlkB